MGPASATSFSHQQPTTPELQWFSNYITAPNLSCLQHLSTDCTENTPFIIAVCLCCCRNMLVCRAITSQQLLYTCLFRGRCLARGLHTGILYTENVYNFFKYSKAENMTGCEIPIKQYPVSCEGVGALANVVLDSNLFYFLCPKWVHTVV
jgi:hypothetical protein